MAAVPGTPKTWSVGEVLTAANLNAELRDSLLFLANQPMCRLTHGAAQSHATTATWQAVTFTAADLYDTGALHDTAVNPTRITVSVAGVYVFTASIEFAANVTGVRGVSFRKNSSGTNPPTEGGQLVLANTGGFGTRVAYDVPVKLAAGDYMECVAFQTSGGALNLNVSEGAPLFTATRIGAG